MWQHDRELIDDFIAETMEHVGAIERDLLELERAEGPSKPMVDAIFRAAHSIKGNAGLFGFDALMGVAHAMETVLGRVRAGVLSPGQEVISALLAANELLHQMIGDHENQSRFETGEVLAVLAEFAEGPRRCPTHFTLAPPSKSSLVPVATIRVSLSRLDELIAATLELQEVRRSLLEKAGQGDLHAILGLAGRVDVLSGRLLQGISALRRLPVGSVFGKFRRVARDLSIVLRKELELEIVGEEVEVEKPVLEALADPVGHLVRNAIDHGIESPIARRAVGKPERGHVQIRASLDDLGLRVEVTDDGRGIDPQRVARSAVEKGLVDDKLLAGISDEQLLALIFEPGFSTAAEVTDISGRGVGMDVVRECVHRVGGTIDVRSAIGLGTTVTLHVPASA